jgi:gliding motility-associatede transport system auxiliary component
MKKLTSLLAPLGLLLAAGAWVWTLVPRLQQMHGLPGGLQSWLIAGSVLVLLHLLLRFDDITASIGGRQVRYGANTFVLAIVVLAILGGLNYVIARRGVRWDLTKGQRFSLSDQTTKVVSGLKDDVKITYFQRGRELQRGQDRLKTYQALSPKIKVEFVDPVADPGKAQAYEVRGPWPILIVEKGAAKEKITNDSEQDITNALIKITRDRKRTVCFAEGEGERDPEDSGDRGWSGAKSALAKNQYETRKVALLREKNVPADCTVFVVAGPDNDLLPEEIDALRSYVKGGGRLLAGVDPETKAAYPNLTALLAEWSVEAGKDIVVDASGMGQLFGAGPLTPLALEYPYHEITKDFRVATAFHMARSMEAGKATIEGVSAQDLVKTSRESWGETELDLKKRPEFTEGKDKAGPVSLGVVVTVRGSEPTPAPSPSPSPAVDAPKPPEGKVAAFGDSDFASNALLGFQGNQDFFLNVVAWLSEDQDLISIRPREPEDQRLTVSRQTQWNVAIVALILLPGLFIVLGIAAWWRRR